MVDKLKSIWMNGRLVDWDDAQVHVLTHSLHYGLGTFEGIRSYKTRSGRPAIFRLPEHIRRLFDSAKVAGLTIPFTPDQISQACTDTLAVNELDEGYVRPLVFLGAGAMGVYPRNNPVQVVVAVWKWGAYLGEGALTKGIRAKISSYARYQPNTMMTSAKLTGNYTTSVLAKNEAISLGFEEAILLDTDGYVAEGSGENIFIVRDGVIRTTPLTCILPGITRETILTVARDMGYPVLEQRFSRDQLYTADEAFFTGTATEVTPIREVDGRTIGAGKPGPVTMRLQKTFFEIVRGETTDYERWLTYYDLRMPARPSKVRVKASS